MKDNANESEKACENCKNYFKHYVKGKIGLVSTDFGHCGITFKQTKNKTPNHALCNLWEKAEINTEQNTRIICSRLMEVLGKLSDVLYLLINDKDV